jgi:hypothetical protein
VRVWVSAPHLSTHSRTHAPATWSAPARPPLTFFSFSFRFCGLILNPRTFAARRHLDSAGADIRAACLQRHSRRLPRGGLPLLIISSSSSSSSSSSYCSSSFVVVVVVVLLLLVLLFSLLLLFFFFLLRLRFFLVLFPLLLSFRFFLIFFSSMTLVFRITFRAFLFSACLILAACYSLHWSIGFYSPILFSLLFFLLFFSFI